ncbi:Aste57867_13765 [Aphanomyces stellatus]|uniref:Aste57867_13765 protein n=1 Tax=Aphanomyces stellatus TaxID=120398 RepID=A0A485KYX4_9STRA|nr:hypothetical protein As57867_013715 [Aphanomyces stellatus]VFT90598.1 Aste57867_13765 [Aphanomyces stellatus]
MNFIDVLSSKLAPCLTCPPPHPIRVETIALADKSQLVLVLDNVLSPSECLALINASECKGYEAALIHMGGGRQVLCTDMRNNDRCILDDRDAATIIWDRIRPFLPATFEGNDVIGINERLRFLRYGPGQEFKPHFDGCFTRPTEPTEVSFLTIQFYLNGGKQKLVGGATTIFDGPNQVQIHPTAGRVLVFQHNGVWHAGSPVVAGRKYTIRSDIMCRLSPNYIRTPQNSPDNYSHEDTAPRTGRCRRLRQN